MEALSTPCSEATTTINGSVPSTHHSLPSYHDLGSSTHLKQTAAPGDISHCDRCNKNFIDKESLAIHLRYYHGDLVNMWMDNPTESREDQSYGQSEIPAAETPLGEFRDIHISDITEEDSNAISAATDTTGLELHLESNGFDTNMNDSLSDVDHLKMISGDTFRTHQQQEQQDMQSLESMEQKYTIPNPSPSLQYNNYTSPVMPSPQGNVVPAGPSSAHSNPGGSYHQSASQYYPEYTPLQTVSSMPQQSPGLHQPPLPHYPQSHYSGNAHHGGAEGQAIGYNDHYASHAMGRFHPYGRSPSASPSVVKEEPKPATSDSQEILDLDTHRFLGSRAGAIDNQAADRNHQLGYRSSMPHSAYPRNTTDFVSPGAPGTIIASSSMFGGGTVHSQRSPPMSEMGGGPYSYMPQANLPSYHQQSYPPVPSVPSASPASSPSSQPGPQTASDLPPSPSDFPTNVKRPKNFRCEVCLKWFTSQGHLKRHYNTNIHRNMLKQKETKDAELAKTNSLQTSPQIPTTTQSSQATPTPGINQYQQSPAEEQSVVSPPLKSGSDFDQNSLSAANSSLLNHETDDRNPQIGESAPSFPVQNNNISSQPARPTPVPASSMFSSVGSFQPGYSQPNYSQINTTQPQYASTPLYAADSSSLVPTSSSSSTTYYGHFSTNPSPYEQASLSNNSSGPPFFQAGSTPMIGGGFLHHHSSISPNTHSNTSNSLPGSSHSQSISPKLISPQQHSGDYQSPEVHSTNEFPLTIKDEFSDSLGPVDPFTLMSTRADTFMGQNISSTGFTSENGSALHAVDGLPTISEGRESSRVPSTHYTAGSPEGIISSSSPEGNRVSENTVRSPSAGSPDSFITSGSGGSPEPEKKDGVYLCAKCPQTFSKKCYYTQHFEKHLIGAENYKCDKCGKKYNDKAVFEVHVSKHEGDKPYKCEVETCVKQFNHKTDLRRHMCLHTGEKPFKCNQCTKGFIRKDHMMKHMQTHKKKQTTAVNAPNPRLQNTAMPDPVPSLPFQYGPMLQSPYGSGMLSVMPPRPSQFPALADFGHPNSYQHLMQQQDIKHETVLPQHHHHHHHHDVPPFVRVDY